MIGKTIHRYEVVTSTNDIARELAAAGADEGTVVVAEEQTKGRGSRGRVWISPPGANLLMSIILRPQISAERLGELAFVGAIALAGTLRESYGLDARIKWPNDVRIGRKKVSGMIVEATKGAVVLGIGVNVNWTDLAEEISTTATSLTIELGSSVDKETLLKRFLDDLDISYGVYRARGFGRILDQWKELQDTIGCDVKVGFDDGNIQGRAVDVDEHGSLIVELPNGERKAIPSATVIS